MRERLPILLFCLFMLHVASGNCSAPIPEKSPAIDPWHVDASSFGERIDISDHWLFAPGDQPAYSSPMLDDRVWKVISTREPLSRYGVKDLQFCWYRLHVHFRPQARHVVLEVEGPQARYEIFANGVKIGGAGNLAEHSVVRYYPLVAYRIPERVLVSRHGDLVLAFRFSVVPVRAGSLGVYMPWGDSAKVYLASQEAAPRDVEYTAAHRSAATLVLVGLSLLVGLVSLALYIALPSQREYLALTILLLTQSANSARWFWALNHGTDSITFTVLSVISYGVLSIALIELVRLLLRQPHTRLFLLLEIGSFLSAFFRLSLVNGIMPLFLSLVGFYLAVLIIDVLLPILLFRGWWRGNLDAGLLLPALLIRSFADYLDFSQNLAYLAHLIHHPPQSPVVYLGSYPVFLYEMTVYAFNLLILLIIVLRTIRIARERARVANEIEAAQTMQQLLLTRSSKLIPGFHIESEYRPAHEVGGDFFLATPGPAGSLLAIVGDVSGKGLLAAMRVSLILGVLQREESGEPALILRGLNEALVVQGETGFFTTACCVRLEHDGHYTVANAGHIAPYIAGRAVETLPSLPLGLVANQEYSSLSGLLSPEQKMVLLSDGVVEARSPGGELYGFDRLPQLTRFSAHEIAEVAQRFGQQDDITVLSIAVCA